MRMFVNEEDDVQAKSSVDPNGVPSSNRFPIDVFESSTRQLYATWMLKRQGRNVSNECIYK